MPNLIDHTEEFLEALREMLARLDLLVVRRDSLMDPMRQDELPAADARGRMLRLSGSCSGLAVSVLAGCNTAPVKVRGRLRVKILLAMAVVDVSASG